MKYIGYSELTKRFYLLPASAKASKMDITDDINEIVAFFHPASLSAAGGATMMTLDEFATFFDKSPVFILRLKELYVYLGHGGIDKGEWAEYNEKARRLVDSLMMKLLPNPKTVNNELD